MAFIGLTIKKNMYYGASRELILRARELRKSMTGAEATLWSALRKQKLDGVIFRRQHAIFFFIVDFYCHKFKLVIEVDGEIHNNREAYKRDENRTAELENLGLTVIRFRNDEVFNKMEKVLETIKLYLV